MQKFTKTEIAWIATEMEKLSEDMEHTVEAVPDRSEEKLLKLLKLRSEQYADISRRLKISLKKRDKRIEIK